MYSMMKSIFRTAGMEPAPEGAHLFELAGTSSRPIFSACMHMACFMCALSFRPTFSMRPVRTDIHGIDRDLSGRRVAACTWGLLDGQHAHFMNFDSLVYKQHTYLFLAGLDLDNLAARVTGHMPTSGELM